MRPRSPRAQGTAKVTYSRVFPNRASDKPRAPVRVMEGEAHEGSIPDYDELDEFLNLVFPDDSSVIDEENEESGAVSAAVEH